MTSFTGNIKHSNGLLTTHKRNSELKILKRRLPLPGYPVNKPLITPEEIENYFNDNQITCLLCGRRFKSLGSHLKLHGLTSEQYKVNYGLPYCRGLDGKSLKNKRVIIMKKMINNGVIKIEEKDRLYYRSLAHKAKHKSIIQPFRKITSIRNVSKRTLGDNKILNTIWKEEDYYRVLKIAEEKQLHPMDVIKDKKLNIPRASAFYAYMKKNHSFYAHYIKVVNELPIHTQAAHEVLGEKAHAAVRTLKLKSLSHVDIAKKLNISLQSINNIVKRYDIKTVKKTTCKRGHLYPAHGLRKCKVCSDINRRAYTGSLPRDIARVFLVKTNCTSCSQSFETNKLGAARPIKYCSTCKRKFYLESQKRYRYRIKNSN